MIKCLLLAVAIIAHEPGYYTSLANHLQRWLRGENIAATVSASSGLPAALKNNRLAFLVGFANPTAAEMSQLRAFRARGGKLVVFYSSSPALAELMGVKPLGYKAASYPGQWSRMVFSAKTPAGLPVSVLQSSTNLQLARPLPGGRVLATWSDRAGRSTGDAAWIATPAGYWMTHVLLADGDEQLKAQLLGALVGSVEPQAWSYAAYQARNAARQKALRALAERQVPRAGEIHAVWDHSGFGLYPGNWSRTMRRLQEAHVTDLFVNVAGAGFAFYPSDVLPRARQLAEEGDQLAACLAASRGTGIRVHAWIVCFGTYRATADRMEVFRKNGWRLKMPNGKWADYLDPGNPAVRAYVLAAIGELQTKYPIHGVHLDYVRYGDGAVKPKDASVCVTRFVADARSRVPRSKWLTTAVYGKYPNCIASVGQDWAGWLDMNLVDYVVPMDYSESAETFGALLKQQAANPRRARRTIVGIGVTANESRLNARQVIEQINLTRRFGFAGASLFDLDTTLDKQILPYLQMGLW